VSYLWAVESAIARVQGPLEAELVQGLLQLLLGLIPGLDLAEELLRACAQSELKAEAKYAVNVSQEIQAALNFAFNL
jgi:hypothetical protein